MKIIKALHARINNYRYRVKLKHFGPGSQIRKPILVNGGQYVSIGKDSFFRNGLRLECIESFNGNQFEPSVSIGDRCTFEQNIHITSAAKVSIGSDVSVSAGVTITTINHGYVDINVAPKYQDFEVQDVVIGDDCFIGMGARILPGTVLGEHVIVGANAVLAGKSYPAYCVVVGIPARVIKVYNFETQKWERPE